MWCTNSLTFNSCRFCPHCIYVFCIYLRTNSDLCHLHHKLIDFYNRDEKCLLRGKNWAFMKWWRAYVNEFCFEIKKVLFLKKNSHRVNNYLTVWRQNYSTLNRNIQFGTHKKHSVLSSVGNIILSCLERIVLTIIRNVQTNL